MKNKSLKKLLNCTFWTGLGFCLISAASLRADTLVTFSVDMSTNIANLTFTPGTDTVSVNGSFAGWGTAVLLVQEGGGTVYTNTVDDTTDANGAVMTYKYINSHAGLPNGGYEGLSDGNNRAVILPSVSGSSLVLPTPFFGDAGAPTFINTVTFKVDMSQQINLGAFTNGGPNASTVTANGTFNNWGTAFVGTLTNDPSIIVTNILPNLTQVVTSNVFTGIFMETNSPYQNMGYKFVANGSYEGTPKLNDGGNRFYTGSNNTPVIMPIVLYNDAPFAPPCTVAFQVDMSLVALTDTNFNPASVTINGDVIAPNGWGGTPCTNDPTAANTNIYTVNVVQTLGQGSTATYQYRYTEKSNGNIMYDHLNGANGGQGNRTFAVPQVSSTNVLVVFNDASYDDYLLQPTPVFFSVNMSNAVEYPSGTFNPDTDNVYVNGEFLGWYAWGGGINPAPAPAGTQMFPQGSTLIYTNTQILPAGTTAEIIYKYGIDPAGANNGPLDDEAGVGDNHERVVRATAFNPYVFPTDTFGYQYVEPYFSVSSNWAGNLTVGPVSGGSVPVTWLGRPGARLQVAGNVTGAWQTIVATDGTNWSIGFSSTNGFVSETNYPTSGTGTFFRLIKK